MASPRVARARELAEQLTGVGINATADADKVSSAVPIVLIGPPRLAMEVSAGAVATWRLMVVGPAGSRLVAWEALDDLVDRLCDELPVETAEPTAWALAPGQDPFPAYAVTFIETVE